MQWKSTKNWGASTHIMTAKQQVKNGQIKEKQTCSLCFVNGFEFQENKLKIVQKNFQEIKAILIKKIYWKSHQSNDHYMINMCSQRQKIRNN